MARKETGRKTTRRTKKERTVKRKEAPVPLKEAQLRRQLKPRGARASTLGLEVGFDVMVATPRSLKIDERVSTREKSVAFRPGAPLVKRSGRKRGVRVKFKIQGAELGTHVFPPPVPGVQLKLPRETVATRALARLGLPDLDGYLPNHLPLNPIPQRLDRKLRVRRYLSESKRLARGERERTRATTIFPPEDRYTFSDTSFPWCTIGRVDTAGGQASGVLVGPRHLLTVSHAMVWNPGNSCGWVRFRPSYFDGSAPFGDAWAIRWYAYRKVIGPWLSRAESREDYVVLVLDRRIGDICGWMGSRTYSDSWDGSTYWRHIGYPGDLAAGQRPSYERDIALDGEGSDSNSHKRAWHKGDVWPGQSGGPFFAWWSGESWPRAIAVQSGEQSTNNLAAAGSRMVNCIIAARNDFP
ncbi:MAG: trypsin-like serine peptidase [Planctomycetota bacterium]|jgi:V8-like Glu-specific endopeptidase